MVKEMIGLPRGQLAESGKIDFIISESFGGIMDVSRLVQEIDAEISRLQQARALLSGDSARRGPGRPKSATVGAAPNRRRRKRRLSPEGRKRIADAMRKRWAERKKQQASK